MANDITQTQPEIKLSESIKGHSGINNFKIIHAGA